jgi:AraC-like DNA-binding protein
MDLPERDRLGVWHELHGRSLFNVGFTPEADTPFHIDAEILPVGNAAISDVTSSPACHYVAPEHLPNAKATTVVVMVKSGLIHARQRSQEVTVGPGQAFAILSHELAAIDMLERSNYLCLYLPTPLVAALVPDLGAALIRSIDRDPAALHLLRGYAAALQSSPSPLTTSVADTVSAHLIDLMANVLGSRGETREIATDRGVRAARRQAIKADIAMRLTDETLTPEAVCLRLGITPRYMRKLLQHDGTTFSDLLRHMRLEKARQLLVEPGYGNRPISAIAYHVGFNDLSYFNRCFRHQFGATPSEVRSRTLGQQ